jgi:hypothetical protein
VTDRCQSSSVVLASLMMALQHRDRWNIRAWIGVGSGFYAAVGRHVEGMRGGRASAREKPTTTRATGGHASCLMRGAYRTLESGATSRAPFLPRRLRTQCWMNV